MDAFPFRLQPSGVIGMTVRLRGVGAGIPTVEMGPKGEPKTGDNPGVTMARSSAGVYTLTVTERPGKHVGTIVSHSIEGTPSATTARFVQVDRLMGTGLFVGIYVSNPGTEAVAPALVDLATTDRVTLILLFKQTGTGV